MKIPSDWLVQPSGNFIPVTKFVVTKFVVRLRDPWKSDSKDSLLARRDTG